MKNKPPQTDDGQFTISTFAAVVSLTAQPNKAPGQKQEPAKQTQPAVLPADSTNKQTSGETDKAKADAHTPDWYASFENPDGALVIVGLITCLVVGWQSWETRRAAKGAFLNAQALINAERPWLVVNLEEFAGPNSGFMIYAKNKGRTPAMIVSGRFGCVAVNSIENLPKLPPYGQASLVQDHIAIPEDEPTVGFFDLNSLKKMASKESAPLAWEMPWVGQIYVFGIVLYRDLLDPSQKEMHETRWIFQYVPAQGTFGDSVITMQGIGVPEYDGYT